MSPGVSDVFPIAFYLLFLILVMVVYTVPMLACVEAPIPVVGYILGLVYCAIRCMYIV